MVGLVSVSSAPIAKLGGRKYYDLLGTLEVMKRIFQESAVDGFELQLEPEWDSENPPLTDVQFADWNVIPKYTYEEILTLLRKRELPILSVHANRDIGSYLCSSRKRDLKKAESLIHDSLSLAEDLEAMVCVFHLWNTWKESLNVNQLRDTFLNIADQFCRVKASVENIPTHVKGHTPVSLAKLFGYITLDLRWASLYNELNAFEPIISRVVNVHVRGRLKGGEWILDRSSFSLREAIDTVKNKWKYAGLFTVEPEGQMDSSHFESFIGAMMSLRRICTHS